MGARFMEPAHTSFTSSWGSSSKHLLVSLALPPPLCCLLHKEVYPPPPTAAMPQKRARMSGITKQEVLKQAELFKGKTEQLVIEEITQELEKRPGIAHQVCDLAALAPCLLSSLCLYHPCPHIQCMLYLWGLRLPSFTLLQSWTVPTYVPSPQAARPKPLPQLPIHLHQRSVVSNQVHPGKGQSSLN